MSEFTAKDLVEKLDISHVALVKSLKGTPYTLKEVEGSFKKVKHYAFEDLPERYKEKLKEQGIQTNKEEQKSTHILSSNFTKKYILAHPKKQRESILKCRLVEFYLKKDVLLNQKKWLKKTLHNHIDFDELGSVSIKQLNDWIRKYKDAKAKEENVIEAFIDARGAIKGVRALSEEQKEVAVRYFLRATRPKITEIYRNMCHSFGDSMPSYDVMNNYYKEWKRLNPLLAEFSKSPDSAKNKFLSAFGSQSAKARYKNQYWELDSTPADLICEDGKRYTILAALDIYSRRVVFHVSESSSSFSISQLLRKAMLKLGIPENVVIDNGRDYTSNHFESICTNLGINMQIVPPFSGECKPHVERVFRTLSSELFEQTPGYIGHNVEQRAEIQAKKSFAWKIESQRKWREAFNLKSPEEKSAWSDAWKIKKENVGLDLTVLISADELQAWCDKWVDKMYEQRIHNGIKTTPVEKWNRCKSVVQGIGDVRMLDLLLGESHIRKVGKKGISFDGCVYIHDDLVDYIGHSVHIMTPDDLGYILVYNGDFTPICIAQDVEHMGESRYMAKKAKKRSQAMMRAMDKIVKEALATKDVTILDRIEAVQSTVETTTYAVTKHTQSVDMLINRSDILVQKDKEALEKSKRYDFKNKDEEGLPTKVLSSGRPIFETPYDRFVWVLENDCWNEKDEKLKDKHPEFYELALKEVKGA